MKTKLIALSLAAAFAATPSLFASAHLAEESCRTYLRTLTSVTTRGGDTYDLSKESAEGAFGSSTDILRFGAPDHLKGDLQTDTKPSAGAKKIGLKLADVLVSGKELESIKAQDVLGSGTLNHYKEALNYLINTFLWDKEKDVTTEVVATEVAAYFCMRHRLINYKKSLG